MVSHSTSYIVLVGYQSSSLLPFLLWHWKETNFSSLWRPFSRLRSGLSNSSPRGWTSFNARWWRPRHLVCSKFWRNYPEKYTPSRRRAAKIVDNKIDAAKFHLESIVATDDASKLALQQGKQTIRHRQKLIRIADRSDWLSMR